MHLPRKHCSSLLLVRSPASLSGCRKGLDMMRIPERSAAAGKKRWRSWQAVLFKTVSLLPHAGIPFFFSLHPTPCVLFTLLAQSAGLLSLSFEQLSLSPLSIPLAFQYTRLLIFPNSLVIIDPRAGLFRFFSQAGLCSFYPTLTSLRSTRNPRQKGRKRNKRGHLKLNRPTHQQTCLPSRRLSGWSWRDWRPCHRRYQQSRS